MNLRKDHYRWGSAPRARRRSHALLRSHARPSRPPASVGTGGPRALSRKAARRSPRERDEGARLISGQGFVGGGSERGRSARRSAPRAPVTVRAGGALPALHRASRPGLEAWRARRRRGGFFSPPRPHAPRLLRRSAAGPSPPEKRGGAAGPEPLAAAGAAAGVPAARVLPRLGSPRCARESRPGAGREGCPARPLPEARRGGGRLRGSEEAAPPALPAPGSGASPPGGVPLSGRAASPSRAPQEL